MFVRICRDASPEASDAGRTQRRNDGNIANAIEIGRVRTPEDGRPYGIIRWCGGSLSSLHGRQVAVPSAWNGNVLENSMVPWDDEDIVPYKKMTHTDKFTSSI